LPRIGYWRRRHDGNLCLDVQRMTHETVLVKALFALERQSNDLPDSRNWGDILRSAAWFERTAGFHASATRLLWSALLRYPGRASTLSAFSKCIASRMLSPARVARCSRKSTSGERAHVAPSARMAYINGE
jgi:hypothetical protein